MKYINRNLENVVKQVTEQYPVVILTGHRQSGKSTMLEYLMAGTGRTLVSLDGKNERALAKSEPELFLQVHKPPRAH